VVKSAFKRLTDMSTLSSDQIKQLKQQAHALNPVVLLGSKGLTDAVQNEINGALEAHELIKIKINAQERAAKDEMITQICEFQKAKLIQRIGHSIVIYRKRQEKK
jgi:RNA-binding protein